jgi:hypothetical protein
LLDLDAISSPEQFDAASVSASDLVSTGRTLKFLIDKRDQARPEVHFINGNFPNADDAAKEARYHYYFALAALNIPEDLNEFNKVTYFEADKRYVAGLVHTYQLNGLGDPPGGDGGAPLFGIQFYPQDVIKEESILEAVLAVKSQLDLDVPFVYVPTGSQQTVTHVMGKLEAARVSVMTLDRILGSVRYLPLNLGEAWGHLRIFPHDLDELQPSDIPVFDELPLDLSVVAGVLTKSVQDTNSHVNLKSKERHTPNAVLRDAAADHPRLAPFADQPAHLVVGREEMVLESATEETVEAKLAERLAGATIRLQWEPTRKVQSLDELAGGTTVETLRQALSYGAKAANLAFLAHPDVLGRSTDTVSVSGRLGYDLVPLGIAVPFQIYQDFIDFSPNSELRARLAALLEAEAAGTLSPKARAAQAADVQAAFVTATFPQEAWAAIQQKITAVLPDVAKVKVRSSANAEDVPNFDGAGLHDSFAADLGKPNDLHRACQFHTEIDGAEVKRKVKPKSLVCAIKGVYASLWNKRAIEERNFAHIDHSSVAMGLVIVPAYDADSEIIANAVVVTRVMNTTDVFGYSLSVQEGNNLVTNPDPQTYSEVTIAAFLADEPVSLTVTRFAKPTAEAAERTTMILPPAQMTDLVELCRWVEGRYCQAKPGYYPGGCADVDSDATKPKSVDLELKLLVNGRIVCKQVREFGGA